MCGIGVSQLFGLYCSTFWENVRSKNWMKGPRQNAQIKVPRPTRPPSVQRRDQHRRPGPFAPCLLKRNHGAVKPPTLINFYQSCNQFCA